MTRLQFAACMTALGVLVACAVVAPWLLFGIASPESVPAWYPTSTPGPEVPQP